MAPLNQQFQILTWDEMLSLTNDLSTLVGRELGVVPETKFPHILRNMGLPVEDLLLEGLQKRGFLFINKETGKYYPSYFKQELSRSFFCFYFFFFEETDKKALVFGGVCLLAFK